MSDRIAEIEGRLKAATFGPSHLTGDPGEDFPKDLRYLLDRLRAAEEVVRAARAVTNNWPGWDYDPSKVQVCVDLERALAADPPSVQSRAEGLKCNHKFEPFGPGEGWVQCAPCGLTKHVEKP